MSQKISLNGSVKSVFHDHVTLTKIEDRAFKLTHVDKRMHAFRYPNKATKDQYCCYMSAS